MKVLVTGADGFVGSWLVQRLLADGCQVTGAVGGRALGGGVLSETERTAVRWVSLELQDLASVQATLAEPQDAVIHLAAVASTVAADRDPGTAWIVNAAGTARVAAELAAARLAGRCDPLLLVVSSGEVYGRGPCRPRRETDGPEPTSPYGASKLGAEIAALETWRRTGLRVVVARPFTHSGRGQTPRYVVPGFARRIVMARKVGVPVVKVGNLDPVRDILHVRDVVDAYVRLLDRGVPGEAYNVASGRGVRLDEVLTLMGDLAGVRPIAEADPQLVRPTSIPHLVGDAAKLRDATGWEPRTSLEGLLQEVLDAQAD